MYVYLGTDTVTRFSELIGVFDLDACTVNKRSREFLKLAETRGEAVTVSGELPKSFVVAGRRRKQKVFVTGVAAATIKKRCDEDV